MCPDLITDPAPRRLPATPSGPEPTVSQGSQQDRGRPVIAGKAATPSVTGEGHGVRPRTVRGDHETGFRQRAAEVGTQLCWRRRGNDSRDIVGLIDLRPERSGTWQGELLNRSIEVAKCGQGDSVGRDRWRPNRCDGWLRQLGIGRVGVTASPRKQATKKRHNRQHMAPRPDPHALQGNVLRLAGAAAEGRAR
jgi:hypothetical protein